MSKLKHVDDIVKVVIRRAALHELTHSGHGAFDGLGNLIDILWLDDRMQVVFKNFGEVVLQLITTEVLCMVNISEQKIRG